MCRRVDALFCLLTTLFRTLRSHCHDKDYWFQLGSDYFNEMVSSVIRYVNSVSAAVGSAGSFSAAVGEAG